MTLARHIVEININCGELYANHLAGDKWKFVAKLDEALLYLSNRDNPPPPLRQWKENSTKWVHECKQKLTKGFMSVAGFCHESK